MPASAGLPFAPRIGAVSYLNSRPLVDELAFALPGAAVTLDVPSRLARQLTAGDLDVALIPSIEYFRSQGQPETGEYVVVSDACVGARGPVRSVKLYARVPFGEIRTLALDEGSRTSATLARVLLSQRYGLAPRIEPFPLGTPIEETTADAIVMIGDRAMFPPRESFMGEWDLAEEWQRETGLPFVFAMWVARVPPGGQNEWLSRLSSGLSLARDRGVAQAYELAAHYAPRMGLSVETVVEYFTKNLNFTLGKQERTALARFYELAAGLDLAPQGVDLVFRDPLPVG